MSSRPINDPKSRFALTSVSTALALIVFGASAAAIANGLIGALRDQ